jgi:hypothetical protein
MFCWDRQVGSYSMGYNERTNPPVSVSHDDHCLTFHQAPLLGVAVDYPFFDLFYSPLFSLSFNSLLFMAASASTFIY